MEDLKRNDRSRRQVSQKLTMLCRHVGLQYSTHAETDGHIENITQKVPHFTTSQASLETFFGCGRQTNNHFCQISSAFYVTKIKVSSFLNELSKK